METEGQASEQPTAESAALSIVEGWLQPETPAEAAAPEEQSSEEPAAEAPETPTEAETKAEEIRRHKLKVKAEGGVDEEIEVDDNELKSGYMRTKDYTRKTQELARERDAVQSKVREAVEPQLKQYQERLQLFEKAVWNALAPEVNGTDWNKLAQENPAEWAARMQKVTNVNQVLSAVKQENERIAKESQARSQEQQQKAIREAVETLQRDIPGWGEETYRSVLKSGTEFGFDAKELAEIIDPRAIKVLHAAHKYMELQKAKPSVENKVKDVPKVLKPGTAEKPDPKAEKWKETTNRVRKSGGRDADALLDMAKHFVS